MGHDAGYETDSESGEEYFAGDKGKRRSYSEDVEGWWQGKRVIREIIIFIMDERSPRSFWCPAKVAATEKAVKRKTRSNNRDFKSTYCLFLFDNIPAIQRILSL